MFTLDYNVCQNWSSEVKEIFCSINMEQVYTTKTVCNLDFMKTEFKKIDESQWLASLPLKPKLRSYINIIVEKIFHNRGRKILFE